MRFAARRAFQGLDDDFRPGHRSPCGVPLVAVRHGALPAELPEIANATCRPCPARCAVFAPRFYCPVPPHKPAPLARAEPVTAGCEPDVSVIGAARVLLRSISLPVWVVRSASKTSSDVRRAAVIFSSLISGTGD